MPGFTATLPGQAYARHGTTIETRLTVIDRIPAEDPRSFPPSPGMAAAPAELLDWIMRLIPPRAAVTGASPLPAPTVFPTRTPSTSRLNSPAPQLALVKRPAPTPDVVELAYETREWAPGASRLTASLYEGYEPSVPPDVRSRAALGGANQGALYLSVVRPRLSEAAQ